MTAEVENLPSDILRDASRRALWMSVSLKGGVMVYVGFSRSATDWLRETHPASPVVSWEELRATAAGLAEVPEGNARDLRLAEALRYFSMRG